MGEMFESGGYMMWLITFAGLLVVIFGALAARGLLRGTARPGRTPHLDAVLFWGAFAFAAGVLGTVVGLYQMASAIEAAGSVAPSIAWSGFKVTLIPTQTGLAILVFALTLWFILWYAMHRWAVRMAENG